MCKNFETFRFKMSFCCVFLSYNDRGIKRRFSASDQRYKAGKKIKENQEKTSKSFYNLRHHINLMK